jgi:hypothetical protein
MLPDITNWFATHAGAVDGFVGGLVACVVYNFVHWRWRIVRRDHTRSTDDD